MEINLPQPVHETEESKVFGAPLGLFARFFGCRHSRMSRPVTTESTTYKYCADCGARRQYDPVTFKHERDYYYPVNAENLHHV